MNATLYPDDAPHTVRQPKTDRLILPRFLRESSHAGDISHLRGGVRVLDDEVAKAHAVLIKWAELESSGQLAGMNENQLQGEFLADVFDRALGYTLFSAGAGEWKLEQHHTIAGQQPDAVLGQFRASHPAKPLAVVELKGPLVHLDRDRSNGRTAVQQCWEYLVNTDTDCRWGIVSNLVLFRLYERNNTPRRSASRNRSRRRR